MKETLKTYSSQLIAIAIFIGASIFFYWFFPTADSNLYLATVTFVVGISAFFLYTKKQEDTKREIASIIVSEIRFAEARISEYRRNGIQVSFFMEPILPNNTWVKNHHLFIKDLDPIDEYPLIRDFYNKCTLLDQALLKVSSSSQLDQKADAMYRGLAHIADNIVETIGGELNQESIAQFVGLYNQRAQIFMQTFVANGTSFTPDAPRNTSSSLLQQINAIMNTPAGEKMKKIAGITS